MEKATRKLKVKPSHRRLNLLWSLLDPTAPLSLIYCNKTKKRLRIEEREAPLWLFHCCSCHGGVSKIKVLCEWPNDADWDLLWSSYQMLQCFLCSNSDSSEGLQVEEREKHFCSFFFLQVLGLIWSRASEEEEGCQLQNVFRRRQDQRLLQKELQVAQEQVFSSRLWLVVLLLQNYSSFFYIYQLCLSEESVD